MNMSKIAFVTGISGFVGGHLAKKLIERGYDVVGLSRDFSTKKTLDMLGIGDKVTLVYGDVLDRRVIQRTIAEYRPEIIFHLAGMTIVGTALKLPTETFMINCVGTANMLEVCRDLNVCKSILVASTDKIYGEGFDKTEDDVLEAEGIYENSKIAMERVVKAFISVYNLPVVVSRACNIYGEFDTNMRIVPNTLAKIRARQNPIIFEGEDSLREYIYVEDVCDALILIAENIEKTRGQAFNIGTDEVIGQEDMVKKIIQASGKNVSPEYAPKPAYIMKEIHQQSLNSDKIRKMFGWKPKYSLAEGLKKTWLAELDVLSKR
jgi:nucleoside-diphosphate-sugar epimerase